MRATPPAAVFATVRDRLAVDGLLARLWLVDYRLATLHLVDDPTGLSADGPSVPVQDHWLGRVFAAQRPGQAPGTTSGAAVPVVGLPVTVRGVRIGVLEVTVAEEADARHLDDDGLAALVGVAEALAHELAVVGPFTDHFERVRRSKAMTLAAEIQWALLPATASQGQGYALAGLLEPAYSVAGDVFDWSADEDTLTVAVCDGAGRGVPAAMATTLCVNALRNARRAALGLADQASLADQALYAQYGGQLYVAALLVELELATGRVSIVDAGSPHLLLVRGGEITRVALDAQLPLGMFDETLYRTQPLQLEPGDRLIIVSDGIHAADGTRIEGTSSLYGDIGMPEAVRGARLLSAAETARHLVHGLHDHRAGVDLDDDAVVVVLDWTGPAT